MKLSISLKMIAKEKNIDTDWSYRYDYKDISQYWSHLIEQWNSQITIKMLIKFCVYILLLKL